MRAYFSVDPFWHDKTVVILGGGASVTASLFRSVAASRLANRCRVIAVNDAVYLAWWSDWLHAQDFKWWQANIQNLTGFNGIKTTIDDIVPAQWVTGHFRITGQRGFDLNPTCIRTGNNSGYQAIHSAIHSGTRKIVLLGFDMNGDRWHAGLPNEPKCDYPNVMQPHFESIIPALEERKIEIYCATKSPLPFAYRDISTLI